MTAPAPETAEPGPDNESEPPSLTDRKRRLDQALAAATSAYSRYVATCELLSCQKPADMLVNDDELAFQVVHQVEELQFKLLAHTLLDAVFAVRRNDLLDAANRLERAQKLVELATAQLHVLSTMSPGAYGEIREKLGRGSGQESPGYHAVTRLMRELWSTFSDTCLGGDLAAVGLIYRCRSSANYLLAEAMLEVDASFVRFRHEHLLLVDRTIGLSSRSLKGNPASELITGTNRRFFEPLWQVRADFIG